MPTIKFSTFLVLFLALVSDPGAWAQDSGTAGLPDLPDNPTPADFLPDSQIVPVSDEGIDEAGDESLQAGPPVQNDEQLLQREFDLFRQLMRDNVLDEADTVAKRLVELTIRLKGPQSGEYAKALTNLAIVQFQTKEYEASKQNFESAIEIIEDNEDRLNEQLINPLKGLGAAQLESGRPDQASLTFRRAVHVTHVNEGPHNFDQVALLESIAETHLRMGDLDTAKEAQDAIYALNVREFELDSLELIPSLMRRAAWQHRAGFIYDERTTFRRIIRIIEGQLSKDAIELVEPLVLLGRSFFYADTSGSDQSGMTSMTSGEIYFRRAVSIAEESADSNWQVTSQAILALGDHYMFDRNPQRARQAYTEAWELLSADESTLDVRREQLENHVLLSHHDVPQFVVADDAEDEEAVPQDDDLLQGEISVSFTVSATGRVRDLILLDADPEEFEQMLSYVVREVRRRIYRPRFVDGVPVDSPNQVLNHKFFYRQSDLDALRAEPITEAGE
ncbi:MAG: tetratricopeptide repeat protein [Gammaproteobacteria bacterium]|nr:tetratricopeptide repeat protein [Gammaproteobacteria bacterium]